MSFVPPPPHNNELARADQHARDAELARSARYAELEGDGELPRRQTAIGRLMRRARAALRGGGPDSTDPAA